MHTELRACVALGNGGQGVQISAHSGRSQIPLVFQKIKAFLQHVSQCSCNHFYFTCVARDTVRTEHAGPARDKADKPQAQQFSRLVIVHVEAVWIQPVPCVHPVPQSVDHSWELARKIKFLLIHIQSQVQTLSLSPRVWRYKFTFLRQWFLTLNACWNHFVS